MPHARFEKEPLAASHSEFSNGLKQKKYQEGFTPLESCFGNEPASDVGLSRAELISFKINSLTGFTLIETIIGVTVFALVGIAVFAAYTNVLHLVRVSSQRTSAD